MQNTIAFNKYGCGLKVEAGLIWFCPLFSDMTFDEENYNELELTDKPGERYVADCVAHLQENNIKVPDQYIIK